MKLANASMQDSALNMTPMIDIVFQLILFFLLNLRFKSLDYRFDAQIPTDRGLLRTSAPVEDHPRLTVSLFRLDEADLGRARTKIKFAGSEWIVPATATEAERGRTFDALRERIASVSKATSVVEGEIKTPLPTGNSVPHGDVMKVLDSFWELELMDVKFEGAPPNLARLR